MATESNGLEQYLSSAVENFAHYAKEIGHAAVERVGQALGGLLSAVGLGGLGSAVAASTSSDMDHKHEPVREAPIVAKPAVPEKEKVVEVEKPSSLASISASLPDYVKAAAIAANSVVNPMAGAMYLSTHAPSMVDLSQFQPAHTAGKGPVIAEGQGR